METFKYQLEKYHGRESRHTCPKCGKPQSFARYVDNEGNYLSDIVGRCNHEDKCGYHLTPAEYFSLVGGTYIPIVNITPKPMPPTDYINENIMKQTVGKDNFLILFLSKFFEKEELKNVSEKYNIGGTDDKRTIYWQIDQENRIRTGKMMLYSPDTGHRIKDKPNSFDWVHRHVKNDYQLEQCLFGLHLINKGKPIAIVESEKTAIIADLTIPEYTWLATGGKGNYRLMEAVKGLDVTLFPDLGAFNDWYKYAYQYGFKISHLLEQMATDEEKNNGLDIADYILKQLKMNKK